MACYIHLHRLLCRRQRFAFSISSEFPSDLEATAVVFSQSISFLCPNFRGKRWLSTNAEMSDPPELFGMTAYDILGLSQTSSLSEIKAAFLKLAKETHPDLAHSQNRSSYDSRKFVQVLAAYEILSDSNKRAYYDRHILSKGVPVEQQSGRDTTIFNYNSRQHPAERTEVVEWLKWYRRAINDVLSEKRVISGSGYFDILERDFYSAVHVAYYGPEIESVNLLPDRFEAEERSVCTAPEVLHMVSGRDLFGMVCLADKQTRLSYVHNEKLASTALSSVPVADSMSRQLNCDNDEDIDLSKESNHADFLLSDAYSDLELHLSGRVIAVATRSPPESEDNQDQIRVYLASDKDQLRADSSDESDFLLGVIKGLGTTSEEGSCYVYNGTGVKTHMIMKHRTLLVRSISKIEKELDHPQVTTENWKEMVKHLHWFHVGDKVSVCECRCTRARLPPSKFWLFEPRSVTHDTGGWYVETFGRDTKGKTVPGQRYWDGLDTNAHSEERLHPAVYLLALAYRTLDIEDAIRGKKSMKDKFEAKISSILSWRKKIA